MTNSAQHKNAAPGTPDPSFHDDGVLEMPDLFDKATYGKFQLIKGVQSSAEGKAIFSAQFLMNDQFVYALGRLNKNGTLDPTFANHGVRFGSFIENTHCAGGKLAVQSGTGLIFMLAWSGNLWADLVLACFDDNGAPVENFGQNGHIIFETPSDRELRVDSSSIHTCNDGSLIISTTYAERNNPSHTTGVIFSLLPNGTPNRQFNGNGRWEFKLSEPNSSTGISACISQKEHIVFAGHAQHDSSNKLAIFGRLDKFARLDPEFGDPKTPGLHYVRVAQDSSQFDALTERPDGSLVAAGSIKSADEQHSAGVIVVTTPNGTPHQLFNNGKPLKTPIRPPFNNIWSTVLVQSDNKIVVASRFWHYIMRFTRTGSVDLDFNKTGYIERGFDIVDPPVLLSSTNGRILCTANLRGINPEGIGVFNRYFI